MATESDINVPSTGAAQVRTLTVTTLINGVPTPVQMQVVGLADANGKAVSIFTDYTEPLANLIEIGERQVTLLKLLLQEFTGDRYANADLAALEDDDKAYLG
jgi:hypothetical protein